MGTAARRLSSHLRMHTTPRPWRLWPGLLVAALVGVLRLGLPLVHPEPYLYVLVGGVVGALLVTIWWLSFSRAPWADRWFGVAIVAVAATFAWPWLDPSIATGHMGVMFFIYALPVIIVSLPIGAWLGHTRPPVLRRALITGVVFAASGWFLLLRTDGVSAAGSHIQWRWSATPEQRLLAQAEPVPAPVVAPPPMIEATSPTVAEPADVVVPAAPAVPATVEAGWPGFRGPDRDGRVRAVRIATDWTATPPVEIWRRPIGPGWSSFAVRGDVFFTQEQRGDDELVSAYRVSSGEPVWRHRDHTRFWESNAGAGPRGTPTVHGPRVYSVGATGILNALEAQTGRRLWSANVGVDTETPVPTWGFSSSPLVHDDLVIVAAAGTLVAYDAATGALRWKGPARRDGYSSPHRITVGGQSQVMLLSADGALGVHPATGQMRWEHQWNLGAPVVQPAQLPDGDVLINAIAASGGLGLRRLRIGSGGVDAQTEERWTSAGLKPYFNDFVIHQGHALGFDGSILSCIELETGTRKWKGGRYGNGQLVLLPEQDLLLVVSEDGELALVGATPDGYRELTRIPALEGKTWNHPVVLGDLLLLRNGEEMVAYRLPAAR